MAGWYWGAGSVTGAEIYLYLEASFLLMMIPAFWLAVIKKQRNRELPLAPFLLGGTVLVQAMRWSVWGIKAKRVWYREINKKRGTKKGSEILKRKLRGSYLRWTERCSCRLHWE